MTSVGVIVSLSYTGLAEIYSGQFLLGGYKQQINVSCIFKSTSRPGTKHPSPRLAFYTPDSVMYYAGTAERVRLGGGGGGGGGGGFTPPPPPHFFG